MAWEGNHPDDRWFLNGGIPNSLIVPFKSQDPPPQHPALPNSRTGLASSVADVDTGLYLEESEVKESESLGEGVRMRTGNPGQRFLICETLEGFESFQGYADSIAELFHAHMERVEFLNDEDLCLRSMLKKIPEGYGLVLLGPQAKTHRKHLLAPLFHETLAMELPISLLIVPKTRWPISKILVLIQGEPHDDAAVEWGIRLAKVGRAEMTLLATVPQVPIMFQGLDQIEGGLPEILSRKSKLGRQLRWAAGRLVEEGLDGTVQLRQGTQEMEIRSELLDRDHDIVIVGAEDQDWLHRFVCSGHPCRFLQWTDRPMLIAK